MDVSSDMLDQFVANAAKEGYDTERMRAVRGDMVADGSVAPELKDFDLVTMSMALHHVEDTKAMVEKLAARLAPGGALLIIDWVAEGDIMSKDVPETHGAKYAISRMGFFEKELREWYGAAGLKDFEWKPFAEKSKVPADMGGEAQLFFARGVKA